jgi:Na+/melibiose symporter-like transporter
VCVVCVVIFFFLFLSLYFRSQKRVKPKISSVPSTCLENRLRKKKREKNLSSSSSFFFFLFFFFQSQSEGGVIFSLFNSHHRYKKRAYLSLLGEEEF